MKQLFTICALFLCCLSYSQNAEITGIITDQTSKEPLVGVAVRYEKGKGVTTDPTGHYKLSIPEGQYDLTFSSIGFKREKQTVTVKAGEKKTVNFEMKGDAFAFNEVTTVSQYKKNAAKENVSTSVVGIEEIKHTNSTDLGEALSRTSGVLIQDGQITIRGGSSYSYGVGSRVSVLEDGLSMMSADLGQSQNSMIALENAKQIEIVKGAASVIYGSSALNGVVNVVTDWPTEDTPHTTIDVNTAAYGNTPYKYQNWWNNALPFLTDINVNHRRKIKNLQLVVAGNITGKNSYLQGDNDWRAQIAFKTRYISPHVEGLSFGVNGSLQYETIQEFFLSQDLDSNAFRETAGSSSRYVRYNIDPHLTYNIGKGHTYKLLMRYMGINRIGNGTDPNAISNQVMMENQYQYRWKNSILLTAGLPFTVGDSRSNLYNDNHITFFGAAYTQLEYKYKGLTVQGGVRYEVQKVDQDFEKGNPVFRTGINYQIGKATFLRGSWGQAYRIPSIGERDIMQKLVPGVLVVPNDTLHAEKGWSSEIGINQGFRIAKNFVGFVDLAFYYDQYSDFTQYDFGLWQNRFPGSGKVITVDTSFLNKTIIPGINQPGTPLNQLALFGVQAHNVENARIFGYELTAGGRGRIGKVGITFSLGYNYNYGSSLDAYHGDHYSAGQFFGDAFKYNGRRITDTSSIQYHHLLQGSVRHVVKLDLELKYWRFYAGTTVIYASYPEQLSNALVFAIDYLAGAGAIEKYMSEHSHGDVIADVRMGYTVNSHLDLGFIVKNVANRFYELRPGKPESIRSYTVQLRYKF